MQKLAMFGGTFNPIHNGHIGLARAYADALSLDKVLFIPTHIPPHKETLDIASGKDRLAMCRIAAKEDSRFLVSGLELEREGPSYTADTLKELSTLYPDAELYLIMGADMFITLENWFQPEEIYSRAVLCSAPRDEITMEELVSYREKLKGKGARVALLNLPLMPYSSTQVRAAAAEEKKEQVELMVPREIAQYMESHLLYRKWDTLNIKRYRKIIREKLGDARYEHSLCVAKAAALLAERYGADPQKAELAGTLHDIMKDTPGKEQLQLLEHFGIILSNLEKCTPKLWHAMAGAAYLEKKLGIEDEEILNAVRYHTTGREEMSPLEKVVFIADFISDDRTYSGVEEMRKDAYENLEKAILEGVRFTVCELAEKGSPIHPDTLDLYNSLSLQLKEQ